MDTFLVGCFTPCRRRPAMRPWRDAGLLFARNDDDESDEDKSARLDRSASSIMEVRGERRGEGRPAPPCRTRTPPGRARPWIRLCDSTDIDSSCCLLSPSWSRLLALHSAPLLSLVHDLVVSCVPRMPRPPACVLHPVFDVTPRRPPAPTVVDDDDCRREWVPEIRVLRPSSTPPPPCLPLPRIVAGIMSPDPPCDRLARSHNPSAIP